MPLVIELKGSTPPKGMLTIWPYAKSLRFSYRGDHINHVGRSEEGSYGDQSNIGKCSSFGIPYPVTSAQKGV
jgi:hypothetical protein